MHYALSSEKNTIKRRRLGKVLRTRMQLVLVVLAVEINNMQLCPVCVCHIVLYLKHESRHKYYEI